MDQLRGKAAIITGAGGGICRAISLTFAKVGAKVACLDVNLKNAEETARVAGHGAIAIVCDVSSESDTKAAVERAAQAFGRLDILVSGAAMRDPTATVLDLDLAAWNKVFATNVGKAMASDHAAQKIRINTLSPGGVETERMLRFGSMEKAREVLGSKHLMQRLGQPAEIAQAALFLASDASSFMTGSDLRVDGGYNAV